MFELRNSNNEQIALFVCFESIEEIDDLEVCIAIEQAFIDCKDEDNPLKTAENKLALQNIEMVMLHGIARTNII